MHLFAFPSITLYFSPLITTDRMKNENIIEVID